MIKLFGIRHHGVGSTKRLEQALKNWQPDIILIEGVMEADNLIKYLREDIKAFTPPVAMLIYDQQDFSNAVYYPFAEYSPEWISMKYAVENNTPIVHFDLPRHMTHALEKEQPNVNKSRALIRLEEEQMKANSSEEIEEEEEEDDFDFVPNSDDLEASLEGAEQESRKAEEPIDLFYYDPMTYLAKLAGYEETEHWWDSMFEQHDDEALFESIAEIMSNIRLHLTEDNERPIDLYREAYMRQQLRKIEKEGYAKIAVVCGAYHVPALDLKKYTVKDDTQLLKDIPKTKSTLQATWIPWTFQNLSSNNYGAGIPSPAWYQFLYQHPKDATTYWMATVAEFLRNEDIDCSSAHIIEAVRLALYLAQMRNLPRPTLSELNEATVSILLNGQSDKLALLSERLIVGKKLGKISESVPQVPLQKQIDDLIKQLKLSKYIGQEGWVKANASNTYGGLDLRAEHDRAQSQFLHRMSLLNIPWGVNKLNPSYGNQKSTKNEFWYLKWEPEFALRIIQSSMYGNTLEDATNNYCLQKITTSTKLAELTELFGIVLKANLPIVFTAIVEKMETLSALQTNVLDLMQMIPNLVQIARYGDVRKTDTTLVDKLIQETVPRICVLLPSNCIGINEDAALSISKSIIALHSALSLYKDENLLAEWTKVLQYLIPQTSTVNTYIKGICTRILFDQQDIDIQYTSNLMEFALSRGQDISVIAPWIEGFLFRSGLFLLHNENLWGILNTWIAELETDNFVQILPILRRAFSKFSASERHKMLMKATIQLQIQPKEKTSFSTIIVEERLEILKPLLKDLFAPQAAKVLD